MAAPICSILCNLVRTCGDPPVGGGPCLPTGAGVSTGTPQALLFGVDTQVEFTIDAFETPPTDADSANDRIVIGTAGVYTVMFIVDYGPGADDPAGGPVTARIRVNGIIREEFVHTTSDTLPTQQSEQADISLNPGDELTLTLEQNANLEGLLMLSASLTALRICP
jgi:hypothetical protein